MWCGDCEAAGDPGPESGAPRHECDAHRSRRVAVIPLDYAHHLELSGKHLGDFQGHLGGLTAGAEEQGLSQGLGEEPCQPLRQLYHFLADQATVQMKDSLAAPLQGLGYAGMVVSQAGGHLSRTEVQKLFAVPVYHGGALAFGDDGRRVIPAGCPEQMPLGDGYKLLRGARVFIHHPYSSSGPGPRGRAGPGVWSHSTPRPQGPSRGARSRGPLHLRRGCRWPAGWRPLGFGPSAIA